MNDDIDIIEEELKERAKIIRSDYPMVYNVPHTLITYVEDCRYIIDFTFIDYYSIEFQYKKFYLKDNLRILSNSSLGTVILDFPEFFKKPVNFLYDPIQIC